MSLEEVDVSQLPPAVLTGALLRMESVRIYPGTTLTEGQLQAIFTKLATQQPGESQMKELSLAGLDLTGITAELFLGATRNLEKIVLESGTLTAEQVNAILNMVTDNHGKLNKIVIKGQDVLGIINPELLQAATLMGDLLEFIL